jgi:3-oxoacyl-[acyl-carrier protein] reductase
MTALINPMDLTGKTILVTGASSGIGRETAIVLSKLGARVLLVARNEERLLQTKETLAGTDHFAESFDLTILDGIPDWLSQLVQRVGKLDGLVHSAGIHVTQPARFLRDKDIRSIMEINVYAAMILAGAFQSKRVSQPNSSIVFLSSVMGVVGQPGVSAYAATKGAIIALTKSLALEIARNRIRVNCVVPAQVQTEMALSLESSLTETQIKRIEEMHPLGLGQPRDVALSIAFLLSDASSWITGSALTVDGGYTAH